MINPQLKHPRTGFHQDIFNRSSHYIRLINSKSEVDNSWAKGTLYLPHKPHTPHSQQPNHENLRLMKKIINIDRRPLHLSTESEHKKSLKNQYKEYRKELAISEQNIKMLKKISNVQSSLSKKKMEEFSAQATKYGQLMLSPKNRANDIDRLFYSNYKLEILRERATTLAEKSSRIRVKRKKLKSNRAGHKGVRQQRISPQLMLE